MQTTVKGEHVDTTQKETLLKVVELVRQAGELSTKADKAMATDDERTLLGSAQKLRGLAYERGREAEAAVPHPNPTLPTEYLEAKTRLDALQAQNRQADEIRKALHALVRNPYAYFGRATTHPFTEVMVPGLAQPIVDAFIAGGFGRVGDENEAQLAVDRKERDGTRVRQIRGVAFDEWRAECRMAKEAAEKKALSEPGTKAVLDGEGRTLFDIEARRRAGLRDIRTAIVALLEQVGDIKPGEEG